MQVTLDIPEDIVRSLDADASALTRVALEGMAIEGYRSNRVSEEQVRRLLGFATRLEVHAFLKRHQVPLNISKDDLDQDFQVNDEWLSSRTPPR